MPVSGTREKNTIVSNESAEIIRMFNTAFNALTGSTEDFYPEDLREEIDALNAEIYDKVNNGVYKCGFATTQEAYESHIGPLFDMLDTLEERLSKGRYLFGDRMTEADGASSPRSSASTRSMSAISNATSAASPDYRVSGPI